MAGFPQPPMPGPPPGVPQGYGPRGQADDHLWSMLSYLLSFVAGMIAPLVVYLVKMNESPYVRYHAAQALNMGITGFIYGIGAVLIGIVLAFATHGIALVVVIPLFLIYAVAHLVYLILAAIAANRGDLYRVPSVICLPMVH